MAKVFNFRQFLGMGSLVLALLFFSSSSYTSVSAASNDNLPLITSSEVNQEFSGITITDEDGNVLDPNDLAITESGNDGMITPYANIVSKQVTVTKQNMAGYYFANSISYSAPSGLLTPWSGTLYKTKTYSLSGAITMYYTEYSGTVYATTR